jgi:hypothetical protein
MTTKIEIIQDAYSQMRISGLTAKPAPRDIELALYRLEGLAAEMFSRNIDVGYSFEDQPDPNTESGIGIESRQGMATNLAIRLLPDFNKEVSPVLYKQAVQSMTTMSNLSAANIVRQVQYPNRMPVGSGNRNWLNEWQRFYPNVNQAPVSVATNKMTIGDINDFTEDFTAYLGSESIASYTIIVDTGLSLSNDTSSGTAISYRIEAKNETLANTFLQVAISVTTSTGRVDTRRVSFEVSA